MSYRYELWNEQNNSAYHPLRAMQATLFGVTEVLGQQCQKQLYILIHVLHYNQKIH